jgi:hypothetical protein
VLSPVLSSKFYPTHIEKINIMNVLAIVGSPRKGKATPLIKRTIQDSLNATTVGDMYAGDIEHRGVDYYLERAFNLGSKLV